MDRRQFNKSILLTALTVITTQATTANLALAANTKNNKINNKAASADIVGKCFGVVGAHEGECGGRNPETGESWGCAGQNPTADLGWKQLKKSECDNLSIHKDAKEKKFVANKS